MKDFEELKQPKPELLDRSQFPKSVKKEEETSENSEVDMLENAFSALSDRLEKESKATEEAKKEYEEAVENRDKAKEEYEELKENGFIDEDEEIESDILEDDDKEESYEDEYEEDIESFHGLTEEDEAEMEEELKALLSDDTEIVDDEEVKEKEKEIADSFKSCIREKLSPNKNIDLSAFTIVNKPISINSTLDRSIEDEVVYPLYHSNRSTRMKRFFASDIESVNPDVRASGLNRLETMKKVYRTFYEHITDPNKPDKFEKWIKCTSFMDIKHLYMAAYKSAFEGSNYITYECENPECENIWLSENIDLEDMIEFKDEEVKNKFYDIFERESSKIDSLYTTDIVPISDKYAISFRDPSIYNVVFESASLPQKITSKYSDMLSILMYIDKIFYIDKVNNRLQPIALKEFKDSIVNTTKVRIYTYSKILKTLTSDEYQLLGKYMSEINSMEDHIKYYKPEAICPKCGKKIEREEANPVQILFQRHNLEAIANS